MNYRQETIKPYSSDGDKGEQVEQMFDNISKTYDKLNHRLSWDIDKYWRRKAIKQLRKYNPQLLLDVATGTGDFAIQAARVLKPKQIIGADISEGMMNVGREKVKAAALQDVVSFKHEDCMALSFEDNMFDTVMAAFGIRNFPDLEKGLSEMCRVLKPGGVACIIELTTPVNIVMRPLFWLYSHAVLPVYGRIISKDKSAYSYLIKTIEAFPQGEKMMEIMQKAGFAKSEFKRLTFGICTLYLGVKV